MCRGCGHGMQAASPWTTHALSATELSPTKHGTTQPRRGPSNPTGEGEKSGSPMVPLPIGGSSGHTNICQNHNPVPEAFPDPSEAAPCLC